MFASKLTTLYGVLLIAATDVLPGMIPNHARQERSIGDSQPIRLSSVSEGGTSLPASQTVSPPVQPDPSTPAASVPSPSTPVTTGLPRTADVSLTTSTPHSPTVTHGAKGVVQTLNTAT